ncbi:MAG: metal-dependent transcriptional regulator [Erysipelotrichaceae bacterium]
MTPSREDYLKVIYNCNKSNDKVTNKLIASVLRVSPPSVSEMLRKLILTNKIKKDNTLGYILNDQGIDDVKKVLRKHRLWEVFLVKHLNYSWDSTHAEAEILEHATSESLANKLNEFLNYPEVCPHGKIIYGNSKQSNKKIMRLSELNSLDDFVIKELANEPNFLKYINDKGLKKGMKLSLKVINEYDGSRYLQNENKHYELSYQACKEILIERIIKDE